MARNLDIALLRAFVSVADHGGMTAASGVLNLTQGAVSQQIGRLEALIGKPLFDRDRRGLRLTPAGRQLQAKARRLLALNDEIWSDISDGAVHGPVRLGVPYDLVGMLAPVLRAYGEAWPQVELTLACGSSLDLADQLGAGRLDLALCEEELAAAGGTCLAVEPAVWVGARGGRAYLRRPLPVSMVVESCAFHPSVTAALAGAGVPWRAAFGNGGLDATVAMVCNDLSVSALLAATVPPELEVLGPEHGLPGLPPFAVSLHGQRRPTSRSVEMLARHLAETFTLRRRAA